MEKDMTKVLNQKKTTNIYIDSTQVKPSGRLELILVYRLSWRLSEKEKKGEIERQKEIMFSFHPNCERFFSAPLF